MGGPEKAAGTGHGSYDPQNHQHMVDLRAEKVERVAQIIPPQTVDGPEEGDLLLLGWGSTHGALTTAVKRLQEAGHSVAHAHLRYLNPFPSNLEEVLRRYKKVLVPEMNKGQLVTMIRAKYLIDAEGLNKVTGQPFKVAEIVEAVESRLGVPS